MDTGETKNAQSSRANEAVSAAADRWANRITATSLATTIAAAFILDWLTDVSEALTPEVAFGAFAAIQIGFLCLIRIISFDLAYKILSKRSLKIQKSAKMQ